MLSAFVFGLQWSCFCFCFCFCFFFPVFVQFGYYLFIYYFLGKKLIVCLYIFVLCPVGMSLAVLIHLCSGGATPLSLGMQMCPSPGLWVFLNGPVRVMGRNFAISNYYLPGLLWVVILYQFACPGFKS